MPATGYIADTFVAGEQPTTAKWNELWGNDASFNNGNGFNDSIIIARHLATNAVQAQHLDTAAITLGYAQITASFSTSATAITDVTGLSLTVTVPTGGRRIRITGWASYWTSSGSAAQAYVMEGSTQLSYTRVNTPSGSAIAFVPVVAILTPSAGIHTYKVSMSQDVATTTTINATTSSPAFILVEAI